MRIALLLLAVSAVVVPTALIPERYSTQQVLGAFKAEGLPLHLTARSDTRTSSGRISRSEFYFRSRDRQFAVAVFEPDRIRTSFLVGIHNTYGVQVGEIREREAWRGNVVAVWTPNRLTSGEMTRIRTALNRLGAFPAR